jgi:hypothetical protein
MLFHERATPSAPPPPRSRPTPTSRIPRAYAQATRSSAGRSPASPSSPSTSAPS